MRYETYLRGVVEASEGGGKAVKGDKDSSGLDGSEHVEFMKSARIFRGLEGVMANRFTTASSSAVDEKGEVS